MFLLLASILVVSSAAAQTATVPAMEEAVGQTVPAPPASNTLAALVAELDRNNPELQAARREVDIRTARVAAAGALPDPTFAISSMTGLGRPPFFPAASTVNAFREFSVAQEIPYPGKRTLRTTIATAEAEAERWNLQDRRRRLVADLKDTYLEYALVLHSLEIVGDSKQLADQLRQVAETRFSVGKAPQLDVVKAQLEISALLEQQLTLEQQKQALTARLNALLFRSDDAPPLPLLAYAVQPLPGDVTALRAMLGTGNAALQRDLKAIEKGQRSLELAKKDSRPDLRVGVSAQRFTGGMPWMYGVDLMVTLPVYGQRRQRALSGEAAAALAGSESAREATRTAAAADLTQAYLVMTAADELVALYSDSVLPQARLSLDSSLAAYQVGTVDFLSVVTSFETVLIAETARAKQQTRRIQAVVAVESLIGIELVK